MTADDGAKSSISLDLRDDIVIKKTHPPGYGTGKSPRQSVWSAKLNDGICASVGNLRSYRE
jgi:hypothetical protein